MRFILDPMTQSASEKGNGLESAVLGIEQAILRLIPGYNEKTFVIQGKKIFKVNGVTHEVDIWVEVDLGFGYKPVHIFECKNWAQKVGKNKIISFSEKIKVLNATKGYFVAPDFTADAEAQANLDNRMTLLRSKDIDADSALSYFRGSFLTEGHIVRKGVRIEFADGSILGASVDPWTRLYVLEGKPLDFTSYIDKWANEPFTAHFSDFRSEGLAVGPYTGEFRQERDFTAGGVARMTNTLSVSS